MISVWEIHYQENSISEPETKLLQKGNATVDKASHNFFSES